MGQYGEKNMIHYVTKYNPISMCYDILCIKNNETKMIITIDYYMVKENTVEGLLNFVRMAIRGEPRNMTSLITELIKIKESSVN